MINQENFEESVRFASSYFEDNAYTPKIEFRAVESFRKKRRTAIRWAAACIALVTITAAAVLVTYFSNPAHNESAPIVHEQPINSAKALSPDSIIHLEFIDASFDDVVSGVEEAYGVTLYNIPAEEKHLTLSYEGNAEDFVAAVNELLGTDIKIEK